MTDLDVLVTCFSHSERLTLFPHVRGHYLAEHLARAGVRAAFQPLPVGPVSCEVLICSEYQCEKEWFERRLAAPLTETAASRMFCLADSSLRGRPDHFSRWYCEWFAARGGVLCHMIDGEAEPYEHWIGIGVDDAVARPAADGRRDHVVFDFPRSGASDPASEFDLATLDIVRARVPQWRLVGTGNADSPVRDAFDAWLDYGMPHAEYVHAAFSRALAVVPGCDESLGLALAEAQVAGACVVSSEYQVRKEVLVPEATVGYTAGDAGSLADALVEAGRRDAHRIRQQASERFDHAAVVERVRAVVGV
jgi:hypothetical protein